LPVRASSRCAFARDLTTAERHTDSELIKELFFYLQWMDLIETSNT